MQVTFLGQQGWMFSDYKTNILVDPVLTQSFGTTQELQFHIYPPRNIKLELLPKIDAVFITNEHLDHFNPRTILLLDKRIPIYVGRFMPECVKEFILNNGFDLIEVDDMCKINIGKFSVGFYIGHDDVPLWERRVYSLHIMNTNHNILVQSDTLISDRFINLVQEGKEPCTTVFISTNNAQIAANDRYQAFDNLLPINSNSSMFKEINSFYETLNIYPSTLPKVSTILFSGGGYIVSNSNAKPFLYSDPLEVNPYLNDLLLNIDAKLLYPGQVYELQTKEILDSDWMQVTNKYFDELKQRSNLVSKSKKPLFNGPIFCNKDNLEFIDKNMRRIENELSVMAKFILLHDFGKLLINTNEYINGSLDSRRFIINLKSAIKPISFILNLNTASFELVDYLETEELLVQYPFGIEIYLVDFICLLQGMIQIWELASSNLRQWYLGEAIDSPVAFLYTYFSEQIRPELADEVYKHALA